MRRSLDCGLESSCPHVPDFYPGRGVELRGVRPREDTIREENDRDVRKPRSQGDGAYGLLDELAREAQHEQGGRARLEGRGLRHVKAGDELAACVGLVQRATSCERQRRTVVLHVPLHTDGVASVGDLVDAEGKGGRECIGYLEQVRLERRFARESAAAGKTAVSKTTVSKTTVSKTTVSKTTVSKRLHQTPRADGASPVLRVLVDALL